MKIQYKFILQVDYKQIDQLKQNIGAFQKNNDLKGKLLFDPQEKYWYFSSFDARLSKENRNELILEDIKHHIPIYKALYSGYKEITWENKISSAL